MSFDQLKKYSDLEKRSWAEYYKKKISKNSHKKFSSYWWQYYHQQITGYIKSIVPLNAGSSVLEAGSGTGKASILSFPESKIVLLDIVPEAFVLAEKFALMSGVSHIECVVANMFSMPFEGDSFDLVWNIGVVEHYDRDLLVRALGEMLRVCKRGGYVCVGIPNFNSPPMIKARLLSNRYLGGVLKFIPGYRAGSEKKYSEEDIFSLFYQAAENSGFTLESLRTGYAGSPLLVGAPGFLVRFLSPLAESFFPRRKFLMLVTMKKVGR